MDRAGSAKPSEVRNPGKIREAKQGPWAGKARGAGQGLLVPQVFRAGGPP
ncbi:hypothetical protein GCM10022222_43110 [Amycolatopsis ultiminotia]|uniref:Uncharacterized protein n=1 Tax=Amycolatopsis ultiminotia TaxID=543629 RepID=A0ABP6WQ00_9PSEU